MAKKRKQARPDRRTRRGSGIDVARRRARAAGTKGAITVVGVGASAGGLEAFTQLLASVPSDAGLALVLIQHLAPNHESSLPVLLATHTAMPVVQASDGARIRPNHVYVIPPNTQMEIEDGALLLLPRPFDRAQNLSIDTFFSSLANAAGGHAIAVVLSGTASDGAAGVREVKSAGGIVIAQLPESAKYDGMPRAAIATGMVDLILTPEQIGAELARMARHPYVRQLPAAAEDPSLDEHQMARIFDLLRPVSGIDFQHYKRPTIRRRMLRRMAIHKLTDIEPYLLLLQSDPIELRKLFEDLLIHVTRFFREPESFAALSRYVFPQLLEDRNPDAPLRFWVCGCATGEEAYSLAITAVEYLEERRSDVRLQIFATDVSESAIAHARGGTYPPSIAEDVGPDRLRRFFVKSDGHYRISKVIRDMCVFAKQDLTRDPPFSRLDLVMCRNVLIYMDAALQKRLIEVFHYALNPEGFLVLGQAETVGGQASLFSLADKKHRIHRKKRVPALLPPVERRSLGASAARTRTPEDAPSPETSLLTEVNRIILDRYTPPGVVVDDAFRIVQFRGQTGPYLEPAPGEASLSLLKMAREGLLHGLRTTFHKVRTLKAPVRKSGLQVRVGANWRPVNVQVIPLTALGRPHYLVLFEQPASPPARAPRARTGSRRAAADDQKVRLLERELATSREYLQSIIQELEAANEELQSANEEILSSNEELQSTNEELDTTKEELQSSNEELNTVNEELLARNEEITRSNSDLVNLLANVQIAVVIVGPDLRIRRFTPMAEKVLNLIPTDLHRSINHINPNINCPDLERLIIECMETVTAVERDVQDRSGRWYSLRIRPYKSVDSRIEGAVLVLVDINGSAKTGGHTGAEEYS